MNETPVSKDTGELTDVLVETVRVQLAALQAGITFWSGWVESASQFAAAADQELGKIAQRHDGSAHALAQIADLNREFLRQMTELPNRAVAEFNARVEPQPKSQAPRRRMAKVKP